MRNNIKSGLLISLFVIMLMPLAQRCFHFVTSKELVWVPAGAPDVDFSWTNWWSGAFQEKKDSFLNDGMGFRPDLIRLNNQMDYMLFRKLHNTDVVVGTNNSLYMGSYIRGYFGRDYSGYGAILDKMTKVKALSDTLARLGKSLILVYTPAKEFLYPENIPQQFVPKLRGTTNHATFAHIGDSLEINQIDFNSWFTALKDTTNECLYPKRGTHWSVYGAYLAGDSLIRYLERLKNIRMPHPVWTKIERTEKPRYSDDDLEKTLNLMYPISSETLSYPIVTYPEDCGMTKPKVIYVGDSFTLLWRDLGFMDHTNADYAIWLWFRLLCDRQNPNADIKVQDTDWIGAIGGADCIVIMYTSFNFPVFGNGFIEKAYDHYYPGIKGGVDSK